MGEARQDDGFKTFNLIVNQPANLLINPKGFPKNAVGPLPAMAAGLLMTLPPGLRQQPGLMDGSIQITGTPTQVSSVNGTFGANNGVDPNLLETLSIRVINPFPG